MVSMDDNTFNVAVNSSKLVILDLRACDSCGGAGQRQKCGKDSEGYSNTEGILFESSQSKTFKIKSELQLH